MSNVPTITPGPDDTGHAPESATETLPLITSAPTAQQNDDEQGNAGISDDEAYAKLKVKRAERRRKKLAAAASLPASWALLCSSPLLLL